MKGTIDISLLQIKVDFYFFFFLMEPVTGGGIYAVGGDSTNPSALWFSQSQITVPLPWKLQHMFY